MALIRFKATPLIGEAFMHQGQRYELIESQEHVRRDGSPTRIFTWQSHCPDCGKPFVIKSGMAIHHLNRRCDTHKKPGKPVSGKYNPYYHRRKRHG